MNKQSTRWLLYLLLGMLAQGLVSLSIAGTSAQLPSVAIGRLERLPALPSDFVPTRPIDVWLPAGYDPGQRYAVLYMHDGQMLFDASQTWNRQEWQVDEIAGRLQQQGKLRPFIVVAIHNAGAARHAEYYPQRPFSEMRLVTQQQFYQLERSKGVPLFSRPLYADAYLKFLVQELKPYIDQHYPVLTDPANTFVMGSSMGGLISLYALLEYPQVFGGAACLSTHWPGVFQLKENPAPASFFRYIKARLPTLRQQKLYFDYGDQTLDALYPPLQQQVDQLLQAYPATLWQSRFFAGAAHNEQAWAQRLDQPLFFLLAAAGQ